MTPINSVVNTQHSHKLFSDLFEGEVVVNIKGLTDDSGEIKDSEYFNRPDRHDITWSLQVRGNSSIALTRERTLTFWFLKDGS